LLNKKGVAEEVDVSRDQLRRSMVQWSGGR
jgi:hypothetical protein